MAVSVSAWGQTARTTDGQLSIPEILKLAKETSLAINDADVDKEEILRRIAEAQAKAGDINAALRIVLKNPLYYSALMCKVVVAQAGKGDFDAAYKTLEKITALSDRIEAMLGIARGYAKLGEDKRAAAVFEDTAKEAQSAPYKSDRTGYLKDVAKAQVQTGDWVSAMHTIDTLPDESEKARSLARMSRNEAAAGNLKGAFQITDMIKDASIRAMACSNIAEIQAKAGDLPGAIKTAKAIPDSYYKALALTAIARQQSKRDQKTEAKKNLYDAKFLARTMSAGSFDVAMLLRAVAEAQWSVGERTAGTQTFLEARKAALSIAGDPQMQREMALLAVAESMARTGNHSEAEQLMQTAGQSAVASKQDVVAVVDVIISIAQSELELGNTGEAVSKLQQSYSLAQTIPSKTQRALTMIDIAIALARADATNDAVSTLQRAQAVAGGIDADLDQLAVLINISVTFIRLGSMRDAVKVADDSGSDRRRSDVISRITATQAAAGEAREAYEFAMEQNTALAKTKALIGVAEGMLDENKEER